MNELEVLLHTGLYAAVKKSYKDWICEINTHSYGGCVSVHLMLKWGSVLASVGKYQVGMDIEGFYKQMIGELK